MQAKNASSFFVHSFLLSIYILPLAASRSSCQKAPGEILATLPLPNSPWESLLLQHPKTHTTPTAPGSCSPFPSGYMRSSEQIAVWLHLEDFQPPQEWSFYLLWIEWHCPVELLKWWSILAAQTSTNLNCSNCNC